MNILERYLKKILKAMRVYEVARETPLEPAPRLSVATGNSVLLKREDLQPVFSFKLRGAYNKLLKLTAEERGRGVIAASAGNHAQGVALGATRLGIKSVIVMPRTTPDIKVQNVRQQGGRPVLHGDAFDEAYAHAMKLAEEKGYVFVHPYDDPDVIAGQGTIGVEIMRQAPQPLYAIFVPVGGGGLIAGVAAYVKAVYPEVKVIGVEAEESACLYAAREKGRRVVLPQVGIFADGVAVRQIGKQTFKVARDHVDEVVRVSTDEICTAVKDIFNDTRSITEPAGALAVAGLKRYCHDHQLTGETLVAIDSGANINFGRLRHVAERSELGEHREVLLAVTIPERPGSFKEFCLAIGQRNVTEFNYRFYDANGAQVFAGVELGQGTEAEKQELLEGLRTLGYPVMDMSDNEMAKSHIRYMVGGHSPLVQDEVVYRFEFPERPGALMKFLTKIGGRWNISMFHYRNHGAAYGRVLVGVQVPPKERKRFRAFLDQVGYVFTDETHNPACDLFVSSGHPPEGACD